MITKRIIPCLDVKDGRVVKGVNFEGLKDVSSPVALAEYYSSCGADELVFYDITASSQNKQLGFVAVHQIFGKPDGLGSGKLRMLRQDKGGHGIGIALDDTGDDEQQAPQESIETAQEPLGKTGAEIVEFGEQVVEGGFFPVMLLQQEIRVTHLKDTTQKEGGEAENPAAEIEGYSADMQPLIPPIGKFLKGVLQEL